MARRVVRQSKEVIARERLQADRIGSHQIFLINYKGDKHLVGNVSKDLKNQFKRLNLN